MSAFGQLDPKTPSLPVAGRTGTLFDQLEEEEPKGDAGFVGSLAAGAVRGLIEPLSILPPVQSVVERLQAYAGDDVADKIGYGLGFFGGAMIPGGLAWKAGGRVAKMVGLGDDVIKAAKLAKAENAAELMRRATLVRGAVGGALWGAGRNADDPQQWVQHVMTDAALGGVGDLAISSVHAALAARWGKRVGKNVEKAVDAQVADDVVEEVVETAPLADELIEGYTPPPTPTVSEEAAFAHGQAMQVIENLARPAVGTAVPSGGIFPRDPAASGAALDNFTTRKLNMTLGLEKLPWADMRPGTLHIVPTPHGDADDLLSVVNATESLYGRKMKYGEHQAVLVGLRRVGESVPATAKTSAGTVATAPLKELKLTREELGRLAGTKVVDETGKPKTFFHGTGSDFEKFDPSIGEPDELLYGPGAYFTDNAKIAGGYAKARVADGSEEELARITNNRDMAIRGRDKAISSLKALDEGRPDDVADHFKKAWNDLSPERFPLHQEIKAGGLRKYIEDWLRSEEINISEAQKSIDNFNAAKVGPNIRPVKLAIKNPFEINRTYTAEDLRQLGFDEKIIRYFTTEGGFSKNIPGIKAGVTGDEIYNRLARELDHGGNPLTEDAVAARVFQDVNNKAAVNAKLKSMGFDGIKHTGGVQGGRKHQVFIAFDPEQIIPLYSREVVPAPASIGSGPVTNATVGVASKLELQAQKRFEDFSEELIKQYDEFGLVRGQNVQYNKSDWIVLKPAKNGVMLTQPGRAKRPVFAKYSDILPLPVVDDLSQPESITNLAKTAAEFVGEHGLWPGAGPSRLAPGGMTAGFKEAFEKFATKRGLVGKDRIRLQSYMAELQRKALAAEDPDLGKTLDTLEQQAEVARKKPRVEGDVMSLAQDRGLTVRSEYKRQGKTHKRLFSFIDKNGKVIAKRLDKPKALQFIRGYGVAADDMVKGLPVADGVAPPTGGPVVPPHTAGESPGPSDPNRPFNISRMTTALRSIFPRIQYFRDVENQLVGQGIRNVKPWTIAHQILQSKNAFRNEEHIWTHGGKLADGTELKGWKNIFRPLTRKDKRELVSDLIETPQAEWAAFAAENGLNAQEVQVARDVRDQFRKVWDRLVRDENIDVTADDFIENYLPHYLNNPDSEAGQSLRLAFRHRPNELNEVAAKFASEMTRKGVIKKWDRDPVSLAMAYTRAGLYKSHMKSVINNAVEQVNLFPEGPGGTSVRGSAEWMLKQSMIDFISLSAYGTPEVLPDVEFAAREVFKTLRMNVPDIDSTRLVNTFISMNYGAFMGFRPSLVLRNLSQTLMTTYPVLGGRYTGYGVKMAMRADRDAIEEARRLGAIVSGHKPLAMEDMVHGADEAAEAGKLGTAIKGLSWLNDKSLWAFQKTDDLNRYIAFEGQRAKMRDAFGRLHGGEIDETRFFKESGLNFYGDAVKKLFKEQGFTSGDEAGKWLGVHAAENTQWLYQLGAGPSMFSVGLGKIMGQYGTWGTWWASYLQSGWKNLEGVEAGAFIARNFAAHAALVTGAGMLGYNAARWTGLSSLSWMGGPAVDWFSNFRNIWMGVTPSGDVTAGRQMALNELGLEDDGSGMSLAPSVVGGRIGVKDPVKLASSFFGVFTPGALMLKDARKMYGDAVNGDWHSAMGKLIGMPEDTMGYEWPWLSNGMEL